jgi:hypothetical protein
MYLYIYPSTTLQVIVTVFESQIACIIRPWGIFALSWQFCHIRHIITRDRHMLLFMDEAYLNRKRGAYVHTHMYSNQLSMLIVLRKVNRRDS